MAYIKRSYPAANGDPLTINYEADEDDFMFLIDTHQYGTDPTSISGWTQLTYNKVVLSCSHTVWYRRATASEPTSVTVSVSPSLGRHGMQLIVCGGVDTTTAFDVAHTSRTSASVAKPSFPAITPVTANSLILYINLPNDLPMIAEPGALKVDRSGSATTHGKINTYYTYGKGASATVPALDIYSELDQNINPTAITIALRDDGNNNRKGYVDIASPPAELLHMLGKNGASGHLSGTTTKITNLYNGGAGPIQPTIQSITPADNTNPYVGGGKQFNFEKGIGSAGYSATFAPQTCALIGTSITAAKNLESEIVSLSSTSSPVYYDSLGKQAKHFMLGDGTNYRAFKIDALDSVPTGSEGVVAVVLEVDGGFESEEYGTVTSTVLQNIDNFAMSGPAPIGYETASYGFLYKHNTMLILGGSTTFPASMETAIECSRTGSLRTVSNQNQQSETQFFSAHKVQIGDGITETIWTSEGTSLEAPGASNASERRIQIQVSAGNFGTTWKASDSCVFDLRGTFNGGNFSPWGLESGTSTLATYLESGAVILNHDVTLQDIGRAMGGMLFTSCPEIAKNAANLSGGNTFSACTEAQYFTVSTEADFIKLHNCTFTDNPTNAIKITGNQSGSWSDPNLTLSGNTKDIEYTGTTNFSIQSTNTITVNNSGSGTLSIVTPLLTLDINSDTAATDIRYFEDDSQTVVDSTTGTTLGYDYPDTDPVDIELVKQGYVPINRQNVTPYNGDYDVLMDLDEAYNSAHGLTITTEYDYVRATKVLTINSDQSALDVRSSLADVIRTNSSYYNTALLMDAIPGLTRVDLTDGMTITSMATWKGAGMERFDAADSVNPVEKWLAVKSVGDITGGTVRYRQTDSGSTTGLTLTNNVIDEAFQYYSDPNHDGSTVDGYDYSDYMVAKSFLLGSKQGRVDVLANAGISSLSSNLYTVPLSNADHDYSGTDPGISADITLVAGGVVGGKTFAYEIVDGGTNTGVNIADQINYNGATTPDGVIPGGTGLTWFELGDMVIHNATSVETERCLEEGTTPAYVGFYVSRASSGHPDFTRFQADDGTYYVPAVFNQASVTNLPNAGANIMLQIYNVTTANEVYAVDPGGTAYSDTYIEGTDYTAGDDVRIRFAELNGSTSFKSFQTNVTASSTGWSLNAANFIESDSTYATNAVDGSTITKFSYTPVNDQFNLLVAQNFTAAELFAFYCMTLTTAAGIEGAYGAFVAPDPGNYKNVVSIASIYLDNETSASQRQTDSARIYRDDGTYPVLSPTTSGFGIDVNWQNVVYVVSTGGSALTAQENAWLSNASSTSTTIDGKIGTPVVDLATDISNIGGGSAPTAIEIRQEIDANSTKLDVAVGTRMAEASINTTAGSIDNVLLVNTTTSNTDMRGTDSANTIAPDNSGITQIQSDIAALNDFDPNTAIIEGSETWLQAMRLIRADAAGSIVDDDAGNYVIKSADGLKDRVTGTYADSSRTITGTDVT